jgi:hypothetical protein
MGVQRLSADTGCPGPDRRCGRGPVRAAQGLSDRCRRLCSGVAGLRPGPDGRAADRRAGLARHRRGPADARSAGGHRRDLSAGRAGQGFRHLGRGGGSIRHDRAVDRRLAGGSGRLALHLLDQPAAGRPDHRRHPEGRARKPGRRCAGAGLDWSGAGRRRSGRPDLGPDRRARPGLDQPGHHRRHGGRYRPAGGLSGFAGAAEPSDDATDPFPVAGVQRG